MPINQIDSSEKWTNLIEYYMDCLQEESRSRYVIQADEIKGKCFFLSPPEENFLRSMQNSLSITRSSTTEVKALQQFVLGDPKNSRPRSISFGYPFFVDNGKLMPLLYVTVSGRRIDNGVALTRESIEIGVNFAAIWEALPGDKEISLDEVLDKFESVEITEGQSQFDVILDTLVTQIEEITGVPLKWLGCNEFFPHQKLPSYSVINSPLLFEVQSNYTNQLLKELRQLRNSYNWDRIQPALRHLLAQASIPPYLEAPDRANDSCLYVVSANDSQRVTVGGVVAHPAAGPEPDVSVSPHPAPQYVGPCQWYYPACA